MCESCSNALISFSLLLQKTELVDALEQAVLREAIEWEFDAASVR